ncbi:restriction endonuclease subunit S [Streptomyces sp. NBC_00075]|uniref:restriction endonuclease subunit S n=1 Tax=Streptomyces sp. NBC_00075 TaxID=2975641 RepID=UPI0032528F43
MAESITTPLGSTLPDGWALRELGGMCTKIGSGATPKGGSAVYVQSGVSFIRSQNVFDHRFSKAGLAFIADDAAERLSGVAVRENDVLLNITGDGQTIARCCVAPSTVLPARVNQHVMIIRAGEGLDPEFLQRHLSHPAMRAYMLSHSAGGSRRALTKKQVESFLVSVPPLPIQRAIAEVVGALDDKIGVNERLAVSYERLLQVGMEMLDVERIPDDSDSVRVTDLVDFNPKTPKPSDDEPVYVDMAALSTSRAGIDSWSRREPKSGTRFRNGDTLLARITPCLENGKTGYVDFMLEGEVGVGSTEFIVMRSRPGIPQEFSYFLARSGRFREHSIRNMVGSSGRQRVSANDSSNFYVVRPDHESLMAFGKRASAAFAHMKSMGEESRTLVTLRETLLPQLLSGRLHVRDAEKIVEEAV